MHLPFCITYTNIHESAADYDQSALRFFNPAFSGIQSLSKS